MSYVSEEQRQVLARSSNFEIVNQSQTIVFADDSHATLYQANDCSFIKAGKHSPTTRGQYRALKNSDETFNVFALGHVIENFANHWDTTHSSDKAGLVYWLIRLGHANATEFELHCKRALLCCI